MDAASSDDGPAEASGRVLDHGRPPRVGQHESDDAWVRVLELDGVHETLRPRDGEQLLSAAHHQPQPLVQTGLVLGFEDQLASFR